MSDILRLAGFEHHVHLYGVNGLYSEPDLCSTRPARATKAVLASSEACVIGPVAGEGLVYKGFHEEEHRDGDRSFRWRVQDAGWSSTGENSSCRSRRGRPSGASGPPDLRQCRRPARDGLTPHLEKPEPSSDRGGFPQARASSSTPTLSISPKLLGIVEPGRPGASVSVAGRTSFVIHSDHVTAAPFPLTPASGVPDTPPRPRRPLGCGRRGVGGPPGVRRGRTRDRSAAPKTNSHLEDLR